MTWKRCLALVISLGLVGVSPTASASPVVAAAYYHVLLVLPDGTVRAWGWNAWGLLGDGTNINRTTPVTVYETPPAGQNPSIPLPNVVAVAASMYTSYALKSDHTVWAWGGATNGALGDGQTTGYRYTASLVPGIDNVVAIAAGQSHVLALKTDGTVWMWGDNTWGQRGDGTTGSTPVTTPVQVDALGSNVVGIGTGSSSSNSYAAKNDGTVWAWAYNQYGTFGNGTSSYSFSAPAQTSVLTSAPLIATGDSSTVRIERGRAALWVGRQRFGAGGRRHDAPASDARGDPRHDLSRGARRRNRPRARSPERWNRLGLGLQWLWTAWDRHADVELVAAAGLRSHQCHRARRGHVLLGRRVE